MCKQEPWFSDTTRLLDKAGSDYYTSERLNEALTFARASGSRFDLKWVEEIRGHLLLNSYSVYGDRVKKAVATILEEMYIEQYAAEYDEVREREDAETLVELAE